jgi:TetR/AcrR family transcriptional repressor of uid operon
MAAATGLLTRALEGGVEVPDDELSKKILDAALAIAADSGVRRLTVEDVATRAGVGRVTVYRRFGSKQAVMDALAARESARLLAELDAETPQEGPIEDRIAAGFVTSLRLIREHPLLSRLARVEPESVLAALSADGGANFALARAFLAARLKEAQQEGDVGGIDVEQAAEILVRLCVSFVLLQESVLPLDDSDQAAEIARRLIAPIVAP